MDSDSPQLNWRRKFFIATNEHSSVSRIDVLFILLLEVMLKELMMFNFTELNCYCTVYGELKVMN